MGGRGEPARPDINQISGVLGNILFGRQYSWLKVELGPVVDLEAGQGRLFGVLEVGSLLVGRVGIFMRAGTQLAGERQVDYSLTSGLRYLFRLEHGRPK